MTEVSPCHDQPPFLTGAALVAAFLIPAAVRGEQMACAPRSEVVGHLATKYTEAPVALGMVSGGVIEVLSSKTGETWTIIVTGPDGQACMIMAGEAWATVPFALHTGAQL